MKNRTLVNEGKIHIVEPDLDKIVSAAVSKGNLKAATKASAWNDFYKLIITNNK